MDGIPRETRRYKYKRLEHPDGGTAIRLIHLQPSTDFNGPLRCYFSTTSVARDGQNKKPAEYFALSYTWGDPIFSESLYIEKEMVSGPPDKRILSRIANKMTSKSSGGVLSITKSLSEALRYLRIRHSQFPHTELVIWADAVCIDQSNKVEKDRQLEVMGLIYRMAHTVLVWLGPESPMRDGQTCLRLIADIAEKEDSFHKHDISHDISIIDAFFGRKYFKRRWTIQERYYAGRGFFVVCGDFQVWWDIGEHGPVFDRLYSALSELGCRPDTMRHLAGALPHHQIKTLGKSKKESVLDFMLRFVDTECLDPSDRVLSLLNVIGDAYRELPLRTAKIGYTSTVEEVYTSMARALYYNLTWCSSFGRHKTGRDDLNVHLSIRGVDVSTLSIASAMRHPTADLNNLELASWVPDWRQSTLLYDHYPTEDRFEEADRQKTGAHVRELSPFIFRHHGVNGLCCMSERFDTVATTLGLPPVRMPPEDTILYMVIGCIPMITRPVLDAATFVHEIASVLVLKSFSEEVCVHYTNDQTPVKHLTRDSTVAALRELLTINFIPLFDSESYDERLHKVMRGRTLFISRRGFVGLGPTSTVDGDQIWKLDGTFILRKAKKPTFPHSSKTQLQEWQQLEISEPPPTFKVVGEAFIPVRNANEDNEPERLNKLVDIVNRLNPRPSAPSDGISAEYFPGTPGTSPTLTSNGFKNQISRQTTFQSARSDSIPMVLRSQSTPITVRSDEGGFGSFFTWTISPLSAFATYMLAWFSIFLSFWSTAQHESTLESKKFPDSDSTVDNSETAVDSRSTVKSVIHYPVTTPCVQCGRRRDPPANEPLSLAQLYIPDSPMLDEIRSALDPDVVESHLRLRKPEPYSTYRGDLRYHEPVKPYTYSGDLLYKEPDKIFIPEICRPKVIQTMHVHLQGHFGPRVTINRIEKWAYWEALEEQVRDYVRACEVCQSARDHKEQICLL